jgi:hypothetical protein
MRIIISFTPSSFRNLLPIKKTHEKNLGGDRHRPNFVELFEFGMKAAVFARRHPDDLAKHPDKRRGIRIA